MDSQTDSLLQKLRNQLEEERQRSKCAYADLAVEIEKHQHVLSLLEEERKGREEEREEREMQLRELRTQLSSVQSQCLELQQDKSEKENLNREVLELKKRLQIKEDAECRLNDDSLGNAALHIQALEEEMDLLKEEHKKEVEKVKQLLNEREKELQFREEEMMGLKASKNQQNQAKAGVGCDKSFTDEDGLDQDSMNVSVSVDILMERYLSSAPLEHSNSMVNESLDHSTPLDISANNRLETFFCTYMFYRLQSLNNLLSFSFSFELSSQMFDDEPLLSISNRFPEENDTTQIFHNTASPHSSSNIPVPDIFHHQSFTQNLDISQLSEQQCEEMDLEKELLNQQCGELREELAVKDRETDVLREEIIKTAEELEEARSRYTWSIHWQIFRCLSYITVYYLLK